MRDRTVLAGVGRGPVQRRSEVRTTIRKTCAAGALTLALTLVAAVPAMAGPNPSPVAPAHTGTACANVLANNPQAGADSHSAPPAQTNFFAVGVALCGLG
jgi:hypothetical protein